MRDRGEMRQKLQELAYGGKDFAEFREKSAKNASINVFLIAFIIVIMLLILRILNTDWELRAFENSLKSGNIQQVREMLEKNPELVFYEQTIKKQKGRFSFQKISTGITPLHKAVEYGYPDIVRLLISKGAEVNKAELEEGRTPLHLVVFAPEISRLETAEILLEAGADSETPDKHNNTPLKLAEKTGNTALIELFRSQSISPQGP
jgi:ankyrin repeat protein